jgi:phosphoribosylformylglycinamidine cyclo-ligase
VSHPDRGSRSFSYREAGVDVERADRFVDHIRAIRSNALSSEIGAFAGGIPLPAGRWREPVLLSATDGVGTKLVVAKKLERYDSVGIDLVAMCVNDLLVRGAEPLLFQDYIACGGLDERILHPVVEGIVRGCELAGCPLVGGETAELPDMYAEGDIDLAGFAVGLVEREALLPRIDLMVAGDVLLGLPSTGIHSNGLSLARRVVPESDWSALLEPTRIYRREMSALLSTGKLLGAAHVTGGGPEANLCRVIPQHLEPHLSWDWPVPPVFELIRTGGVDEVEMRRVFNLGLGMILIAHREDVEFLIQRASKEGFLLHRVGLLVDGRS